MRALRRFLTRLGHFGDQAARRRTIEAKRSTDIWLCKPPKIFAPACRPRRRAAKPC